MTFMSNCFTKRSSKNLTNTPLVTRFEATKNISQKVCLTYSNTRVLGVILQPNKDPLFPTKIGPLDNMLLHFALELVYVKIRRIRIERKGKLRQTRESRYIVTKHANSYL